MTMPDWQEMLTYQQHLTQFSRRLLVHSQEQQLSASERELLAWIYLAPEQCTPLFLSKQSGMKKEAVSRTLKQLFQKACIEKHKVDGDERSYTVTLTGEGRMALDHDCKLLLEPFYTLRASMGEHFDQLFALLKEADHVLGGEE